MHDFPGSVNWKKWFLLLLGILIIVITVGELGILNRNQKLSLNNNYGARNYSLAISPSPFISQNITSLPLSSPNHFGTVTFFKDKDGEMVWIEGMFTYVAQAGTAGDQNTRPHIVSGVVQTINGDVYTIAPLPEVKKNYVGPPTISIRALPATSFWRITYTPVDKYISKMTDKRKISLEDVKLGDIVGFRDLDVSNGMITSLTVYDY